VTAEVAVMNKLAVALAADSAVTVGGQRGQKIFNSANKLFALSRHAPVGAMIYGAASFMGMPWETIIKVYRSNLGTQKFDTLQQYAEHFLGFLRSTNPMFDEKAQDNHFEFSISSYMAHLKKKIDQRAQSIIATENGIDEKRVEAAVSELIHEEYDSWSKRPSLDSMPPDCARSIVDRHTKTIQQVRDRVLQNLPVNDASHLELEAICGLLFTRDHFMPNMVSGLVLAGFGDKEVYPRLLSYSIDCLICGHLKLKPGESTTIGADNNAAIVAFAQSEMVHSFISGIDPGLNDFVTGYLDGVFQKMPEFVANTLGLTGKSEREAVVTSVTEAIAGAMGDFRTAIVSRQRDNYVSPVMNAVAALPKDELAEMAESLVNLTSFKRRVSMQDETVGGPVDVVVISKGDGLIWIKRKHYFDAALNPQYMVKYRPEVIGE
jgi:hypothetical protein